ncbi:MAG: polysaccharide deacetylase family protein [Planctomycetota bacterium]
MSFLRQFSKRLLTACLPPQRLLTRGGRSAAHERPRLALTFDDGPHPIHTPQLLDVLRSTHVCATFFVVGKDAEQHPDLIRRIVKEGHELGNHTWSHSEPSQTSPQHFLEETRRTDSLLQELTGTIPTAMRPPKGELNWTKLTRLWRQQKTVALWSADPRDYKMTSFEEMRAWSSMFLPADGDVLLFHDNHPWAATAIETMFRRGLFEKYQPVTVSVLTRRKAIA